MKNLFLITALCCGMAASSQDKQTSKSQEATPQDRNIFYKFLIPASINGSDIAPAAITSFKVDLGDDDIKFKYGRPFKKTKTVSEKSSTSSNALKNSFFFSAGLKATDGVATLYKYEEAPVEVSFKTGVTFITKNTYYTFTAPAILAGQRSTEKFHWVNIIPSVSFSNLNIFSNDTAYSKKYSPTYRLMASYNMYFHSRMGSHKIRNSIVSGGLGFGRINNYTTLQEITREKGVLYSAPGYTYYTQKEEAVKGRLGTFEEFTGGLFNFEAYKSLRRDSGFTCYLGARYFGYFGEHYDSGGSLGFYFSFSSKGDNGEMEEKFGFAITGGFKHLQRIGDDDFRKNFGITFSASVPLKFNYDSKPAN